MLLIRFPMNSAKFSLVVWLRRSRHGVFMYCVTLYFPILSFLPFVTFFFTLHTILLYHPHFYHILFFILLVFLSSPSSSFPPHFIALYPFSTLPTSTPTPLSPHRVLVSLSLSLHLPSLCSSTLSPRYPLSPLSPCFHSSTLSPQSVSVFVYLTM